MRATARTLGSKPNIDKTTGPDHTLPLSPIDPTKGATDGEIVLEMLRRSEKEVLNRNQISDSASNSAKTVQEFFILANRLGFYSPARYDISFDKQVVGRNIQDMLTFQCIDISFPGKNFRTADVRTYGPVRRPVIDAEFNGEVTLNFRVSRNFQEVHFINDWMEFISSSKTRYDVQYYDDYVCNLYIDALDKSMETEQIFNPRLGPRTSRSNKLLYKCELREVYPKSMDNIPLGFAKSNEISTFNVTFSYRDWRPIPITLTDNEDLQNQEILRQFDRRQVGRPQTPISGETTRVGVDFGIPSGDTRLT